MSSSLQLSSSTLLPLRPQSSDLHEPDLRATTSLRSRLSKLCREGRLDAARRVFDAIPRPAPTLLWNTLLIGYVCNSMPLHALRLYSLMNHIPYSSPSDHYTYSSALKACADAHQLHLGKSIHCQILRRSPAPPKNRVLNNSLLNMYASAMPRSPVDIVRTVFDRMPKRNVISWNTLIAWSIRSGRPADALEQFRSMMSMGIVPTVVSFVNVFPAAAVLADKNCFNALYGLLVKYGSEYVNDLFVVSSAILMFSELSDILSARRVFDSSVRKNVEVWNSMIGAYVQNDRFEDAVELFTQVLELGTIEADAVSCVTTLMAISQLQNVIMGQQLHAHLIKKYSSKLPLILYNALIVMYSRCGCVHLAFELFHQMLERDVVSWNTMISAFVQNGLDFEGLLLVYEMQKEGCSVDSVTITALLSAASNLGNSRIGRETHAYLTRHGIHCAGMESYLIDMYAKSGSVEIARRLFDGCQLDERDQVIWNAMITGYAHSEQKEEAMLVFRMMLGEDQTPNSVTLSSVLPACSLLGDIQAGRQIHGFAVRRYLDTNVFVGSALVDMYSKCGAINFAERVFHNMAEKNTVTYTTMLLGLGQHGLGKRALDLFQSMKDSGVKPDGITFVAVISACSYSGLVDEGLLIFESMEEFGIEATAEHSCCVVDLLGRAGRVEQAYEFVQSLGDSGDVVGIWGSLLAACKVHGKFELGKLVAERLFQIKQNSDVVAGYHVLLSNVYAAEGKWQTVNKVRKEMRDRGLRKEPGSSWIEVGDSSHRFMSRDQRHPENEQISSLLQGLISEMKLSGYDNMPVDDLCLPGLIDAE
ncbi:pentatricopeptide repeat-containing protein At3g22150, chloroplastic [Dioscorea cayenensis subsp. rotundata]|uniref:Pentatricopeptide repeat-containing protein At3g22150, chloroplastic n=1 Tax=Dioscorea cayennensis subsp. rotundata TaxID=55577 RepID=A0AB40CQT1_DIOCR|nr:pentatricopeptide repeat-containing protein At3g22150, chloroplastic [Dioscorea cayenensis subsp. rotundata]